MDVHVSLIKGRQCSREALISTHSPLTLYHEVFSHDQQRYNKKGVIRFLIIREVHISNINGGSCILNQRLREDKGGIRLHSQSSHTDSRGIFAWSKEVQQKGWIQIFDYTLSPHIQYKWRLFILNQSWRDDKGGIRLHSQSSHTVSCGLFP